MGALNLTFSLCEKSHGFCKFGAKVFTQKYLDATIKLQYCSLGSGLTLLRS